MTMLLTFTGSGRECLSHAGAGRPHVFRCAAVLATAVLVAIAGPVSACDKSAMRVASTPGETRSAATFFFYFVTATTVIYIPALPVVLPM